MEPKNKRFDELMSYARKIFADELIDKIERMNKLLLKGSDELTSSDYKEIINFFHTIGGTASTLGIERLARIGKEHETEIRERVASGSKIIQVEIEELLRSLEAIKGELDFIEPSHNSKKLHNNEINYINMPDSGKILLIDDDIAILKLLEGAFTDEGYTVYVCDDSLSALDVIAICKPDIILLDIMMPKCDGYKILDKIKADPEYSDICVIFLSSMGDLDNKIKGMKSGVDDYITKPFIPQEVISRVEMVLRRADKFRERLLKDGLTHAYSRSYFNDRIKDELERYKRYRSSFSLAFIDLDLFKAINDTYGHSAGDYVLERFVSFMLENLRESDCIFRYGGEEFVILMPDINEEKACAAMERLQEGFNRQIIEFGGCKITVTFSCGIKQVSDDDETPGKFVGRADDAMYIAKNLGRNRVVRYSEADIASRNKKTLLLVDDENTILKLIGEKFAEDGYNVVTACNGKSALELLNSNSFDAVILDLMLPDIDGLEVCRKIKENPISKFTRVIILSQKTGEADIISGLKCGADDYITKPFSMAELETRVMRILNR